MDQALTSTTSLRPATQDDLTAIAAIEARVYLPPAEPWSRAAFLAELEKPYSRIFVLTDDETDEVIYGYCVIWNMEKQAQILNVAVDLPHRGLGLAKKILSQVIQYFSREGAEKILLEVRKSNLAAIQLYQFFRFNITHIRKNFYSNGEDAYQMVLELGEEMPFKSLNSPNELN